MRPLRYALFATALLIAAPVIAKRAPVDIGPEPSWTTFKAIAEGHFEQTMFDYPSAHFQWQDRLTRRENGWFTCVGVNGKNQYGAYTGWQWINVKVNMARTRVWSDPVDGRWDAGRCQAILSK